MRKTIIGMPALEGTGAVPSAELAEVPASWSTDPEPFDLEAWRAVEKAEDDALYNRLRISLMDDLSREFRARRSERKTKRRSRIGDIATGVCVMILVAFATVAVWTSITMKGIGQ